MFGYIRIKKDEQRVREFEYYRAVYCGLCRSLGRCGGQCARFTLSYDFSFMALIRMSLAGVSPTFKKRRCIAHPFKKRMMAELNSELEFSAAVSLLLAYHKIRDDIADEKGTKKIKAVILSPILSLMKRKPSKKYRELEARIINKLRELSEYERTVTDRSIDKPAEIFGGLLSLIMSEGLSKNEKAVAAAIGYHIGKWIYIVDAADDYRDDVKNGRFNPIAGAYGNDGLTNGECEGIESALKNELLEAEKAFDLVEYIDRDSKEIVENIIYLGMPDVAKSVIEKLKGREDSQK